MIRTLVVKDELSIGFRETQPTGLYIIGQAGELIQPMDVCHVNPIDNKLYKMDSGLPAVNITRPYLALDEVQIDRTGRFLMKGTVTHTGFSYTPGFRLVVPTIKGFPDEEIDATPTGLTVLPRIIGKVLKADEVYFDSGYFSNTNLLGIRAIILNEIYPIGSIYLNITDTDPALHFNWGTWNRIKETVFIGGGTPPLTVYIYERTA